MTEAYDKARVYLEECKDSRVAIYLLDDLSDCWHSNGLVFFKSHGKDFYISYFVIDTRYVCASDTTLRLFNTTMIFVDNVKSIFNDTFGFKNCCFCEERVMNYNMIVECDTCMRSTCGRTKCTHRLNVVDRQCMNCRSAELI